MRRIFRKSQFKYGVAVAIVLNAAALRLVFLQGLGMRAPFLTFVPAVMLAALYGGLRAGLLATVLSALLADYFWLEPAGQFSMEHGIDWLSLAIFLASGTLVSWITEAMLRARARVAGAEAEAGVAAERVQAAEALRAGEERLRFALETSRTGAWDLDLVDHSAFRSVEHDRIFGYEELLPQWTYEMFLEHVLPEDREAVDAKFRHAMATQGDWNFECRIRRADGEVRWIWAAGRHRSDSGGGMRRMAGIVQDITERKRAAEALQESERRLRLAQQAARIGSFEWNIQTKVNIWTPELEAMYGLQPGQFGGTEAAWEQLVYPEDRERMIHSVNRSFETGQPVEGEWRVQWADGSVRWIHGRFQLQKDETGKPLRLTGVNIDITERKQAQAELEQHRHHLEDLVYQRTEELEAANSRLQAEIADRKRAEEDLRESEERQRLLGDNLPTSAVYQYMHDPDGSPRFLYISAGIEPLMGIKPQDVLHDSAVLYGRILPEHIAAVVEAEALSKRELSIFDMEVQMRRMDGQVRWMHLRSRPRKLANGQVVWDGVETDITERKRAEQQLRDLNETLERRVTARTEEADQRAHQLSELAAELTRAEQRERQRIAQVLHDHLQQLLVGARFNISVVRNRIAEPQLRESLQQITDLLDESVRASRSLTAELSPPVLRQGTLADIMRWLIQWMRDRHDLEVHVKTDDQVDTQAEEIRALLFEASRELLFNVVKHAGVRQACLELARCDGGSVRVTIADQGRGFDPACLRTGQGAATGFGLFSIEERLRFLGGQIDIESRRGAGTRASVIAPLQPRTLHGTQAAGAAGTQAQPALLTQLPPARPSDIRVLLADDHQVVRDGLAKLLQLTDGIQVVAQASDGQEALDLARQLQPDVVIMDVAMPRLNGIEATRQLHAEHPAISVIGLSMHVEPNVAQAMTAAGAATYLAKTAPPESLVAAVLAAKPADSSSSSR